MMAIYDQSLGLARAAARAEDAEAQVARLEGEKAALAAVLRDEGEIGDDGLWHFSSCPQTVDTCSCASARAALSGDGKGWLELREQVRHAIEAARLHGTFKHGWVVARLDEAAAALGEE